MSGFRRVRSWGGRTYGVAPTNQIQSPGLQKRIAEFMQLKEGSPAPTLAGEIQPTLIVGDISKPQKQDAERWCSDGIPFSLPAAAPLGGSAISNPIGSGIVVEVKRITISCNFAVYSTGMSLLWGFGTGTSSIPPNFAPEFRSKYVAGFPRARYHSGQGTSVGVPAVGLVYIGFGPGVFEIPADGIVIPPGFFFEVQQGQIGAAGLSACVHFVWTESDEAR